MGLLYEYSSPDDRVYRDAPPPPQKARPDPTLAALDKTGPDTTTSEREEHDTQTASASPGNIRTADVAVASIFTMMSFCVGLFFSALVFTPPPPEDFAANPDAFQVNMEAILSISEVALITLYSYTGVHFALAMFVGFAYVGLRLGGDWGRLGLRRLSPDQLVYPFAMGAVGMLGIRGGTLLAASVAGEVGNLRASLLTVLENTPNSVLLVGIILWIVVLPFTQELFFRGIIYTWLRQSRQPRSAIIVHSLINGLVNLYLLEFFSSVLIAAGLAYIYERTGSILASYIAHSTFNFLTVIFYISLISFGG